MEHDDVSDDVLKLLESGKINYPRTVKDRNKIIAENFGKVWDALLDININANVAGGSNIDKEDKLNEIGYVSYDDDNSRIAWEALTEVLMLVVISEDALGIDIAPSSKYDKPNDFSLMKAKIRSRVRA